jgi:ATP-dependent 26S proteasome regulatory subunit
MKDTIEAFIRTTHISFDSKFDDFVADKGKGLVMLLHGPPEAGKTLTAGC